MFQRWDDRYYADDTHIYVTVSRSERLLSECLLDRSDFLNVWSSSSRRRHSRFFSILLANLTWFHEPYIWCGKGFFFFLFLQRMPFLKQPSPFIPAWDQQLGMPWLVYPLSLGNQQKTLGHVDRGEKNNLSHKKGVSAHLNSLKIKKTGQSASV